jgi:hypothetical protein
MHDITELARNAWNAARTDSAPVFDDLEESYRQRLLDRAQNVATLGYPTSEGGIFQTFEQNVIEVLQPERFHPLSKQFAQVPEEVKEELVAEVEEEKPKKKAAPKTPVKKAVKAVKKAKK